MTGMIPRTTASYCRGSVGFVGLYRAATGKERWRIVRDTRHFQCRTTLVSTATAWRQSGFHLAKNLTKRKNALAAAMLDRTATTMSRVNAVISILSMGTGSGRRGRAAAQIAGASC